MALACCSPPVADAAIPGCTFTTANVAFGSYDPTSSTAGTASGSITIQCLVATTVKIGISPDASGAFDPRSLTGTGGSLTYLLNMPSGTLWGDGTLGTNTYTASFNAFSAAVPIAGIVKARQSVAAGNYMGTLTVTATY